MTPALQLATEYLYQLELHQNVADLYYSMT